MTLKLGLVKYKKELVSIKLNNFVTKLNKSTVVNKGSLSASLLYFTALLCYTSIT